MGARKVEGDGARSAVPGCMGAFMGARKVESVDALNGRFVWVHTWVRWGCGSPTRISGHRRRGVDRQWSGDHRRARVLPVAQKYKREV